MDVDLASQRCHFLSFVLANGIFAFTNQVQYMPGIETDPFFRKSCDYTPNDTWGGTLDCDANC